MAALEAQVRRAARGVDILFIDANYTDEEYRAVFHFGHGSMTQAYDMAKSCQVGRLVMWHHDRARTDTALDELVTPYIERGRREGLTVEPARKGVVYDLAPGSSETTVSGPP